MFNKLTVKKWLIWTAVYCFLSVSPAVFSAQKGKAQSLPVGVEQAKTQTIAPFTMYPGTLISKNDARLAAEVEGRLLWVADVGLAVQKGDVLARIDDVLIKEQLAEEQAAVSSEQARYEFSSKEVKRLTRLIKKNNAAQNSLDQAISDRAVSRNELKAAQARLEQANQHQKRTNILAPYDGVVSERYKSTGEWTDRGKDIVRLVDTGELEVQVWIPITSLSYIQLGNPLTVIAGPETAQGTVSAIVPVGDDRSRLFELRIAIKDTAWKPGKTLRVMVPTANEKEVIAVPRDALVLRRDGVYVFRIDEDMQAERITVQTGIAAGSLIEVVGDIKHGDKVVTRGGERLRPGQSVTILPSGK
jgi:RND family efflux transporter MFP subunit